MVRETMKPDRVVQALSRVAMAISLPLVDSAPSLACPWDDNPSVLGKTIDPGLVRRSRATNMAIFGWVGTRRGALR